METIKTNIKDVQVTVEGNLILLCNPTAANAKGTFVMNAAQTARICQRVGIPNALVLKHVLGLSNGTAKLAFQAEACVAGATWTNAKTGETGVYEKDWTKYSNHEIELGFASKSKVAEVALQSMFANPQFAQAQVSVPAVAQVAAPAHVDEPAANAETKETPIV